MPDRKICSEKREWEAKEGYAIINNPLGSYLVGTDFMIDSNNNKCIIPAYSAEHGNIEYHECY